MPVIHVKVSSRKGVMALAIIALIFFSANSLLLSTYVTLFYTMSEEYKEKFPPKIRQFQNPTPFLFLYHMSILITGFILYVYVYILNST